MFKLKKNTVLFGIPFQNKILINQSGGLRFPSVCMSCSFSYAGNCSPLVFMLPLLKQELECVPTMKVLGVFKAKGNCSKNKEEL